MQPATTLKTSDIIRWVKYWTAAKMVAFDKITSFDRVYEARQYCSCMRLGVFHDVTDLQIWRALTEMRGAA